MPPAPQRPSRPEPARCKRADQFKRFFGREGLGHDAAPAGRVHLADVRRFRPFDASIPESFGAFPGLDGGKKRCARQRGRNMQFFHPGILPEIFAPSARPPMPGYACIITLVGDISRSPSGLHLPFAVHALDRRQIPDWLYCRKLSTFPGHCQCATGPRRCPSLQYSCPL